MATSSARELTVKSVSLGILLTLVLAAANAYLGLKIGTTLSASIPAAVIGMSLLRFFKGSHILENSIVQTTASAGEALAAGVIFTMPALLITHVWGDFNYFETAVLATLGGLLGVLFSVLLRQSLLKIPELRFPEGVAIGNVLKASVADKSKINYLLKGGLAGGLISFGQTGLQVFSYSAKLWAIGGNTVFGLSWGFDTAVMGAGYIVGISVGASMMIGAVVGWIIGIPLYSYFLGVPHAASAADAAMAVWADHIRYIGVGTMLFGGVWTLVGILRPVLLHIRESFAVSRAKHQGINMDMARTDKDIPMKLILILLTTVSILLYGFILYEMVSRYSQGLSLSFLGVIVFFTLIYVVVMGFLTTVVSGYLAGLIGSSNSPISGLMIIGVLGVAIFLSLYVNAFVHGEELKLAKDMGMVLSLIATIIIACSAGITNDTIQDFKSGSMVGSTPWKQQLVLCIGVVLSALIIAPVLRLLFHAYGMGGVAPHPGMDPAQMLPAPQAGLIAAVAQGVFQHDLPWLDIGIGVAIAIVTIIIDSVLKRHGKRLPVLAMGMGIYLPIEISTPLVIGGIISYLVDRRSRKEAPSGQEITEEYLNDKKQNGVILSCGLVAGASLMGVILAVPFVIWQSTDIMRIAGNNFTPIATALSLIITVCLAGWLYKVNYSNPNK